MQAQTESGTYVDEAVVQPEQATSAKAVVKMGVGQLDVRGGDEALLRGRFEYGAPDWKPQVSYQVEDRRGLLEVRQPQRLGPRVEKPDYHWDLALGQIIPMDLALNVGAGRANVDLGGTRLRSLETSLGSGKLTADLTGGLSDLDAVSLQVGSGRIGLMMNGAYPALSTMQLAVASGVVDLALDGTYAALETLAVRGASGEINLGLGGEYEALERLAVETASGHVNLNLGAMPPRDLKVRVNCVAGEVNVVYPAELGVALRFTSVTGRMVAPDFRQENGRYVNDAFSDEGPHLELRVSSVSGKVILQPREA